MVYVNDKKFACETCIKGHRSSSCNHTERPLYEIKKKGRPISQCERCRQLRQVKKKHTKCTCAADAGAEVPAVSEASGSGAKGKARRFIPIAPALPNGLKDALNGATGSSTSSNPKNQADSSPSSCCCGSSSCKCSSKAPAMGPDGIPPTSSGGMSTGLAALAQAAALCCKEDSACRSTLSQHPRNGSSKHARGDSPSPPPAPSSSTQNHVHKRTKSTPTPFPFPPRPASYVYPQSQPERGPELPPILPAPGAKPLTIPPLSAIASLAGSGCCCGLRCACPGCVEHRGPELAARDRDDCPGCGSCVDHEGGVELDLGGGRYEYGGAVERFLASASAGKGSDVADATRD